MKMRRIMSLGLALVASTTIAGCSALDSIGSDGDRISGTYELRTVNGRGLPAVLYEDRGYRLEILNANFTIDRDGTYSEAGIVREIVNGSATTSSNSTYGYYDYYNGEVTFEESGGRRYYGTMQSNRLTIIDDGVTLVYQRY